MKNYFGKGQKKPSCDLKKDDKKMKYPEPRLKSLGMRRNKGGQMIMIGILVLIMALLIFIATLPATKDLINVARGCNYLNCDGYVDPDASGAACTSTNRSYDSTLEEDTLACTVIDLTIPFLILAVLGALVYLLMHGGLVQKPEPNPYASIGYGGY